MRSLTKKKLEALAVELDYQADSVTECDYVRAVSVYRTLKEDAAYLRELIASEEAE